MNASDFSVLMADASSSTASDMSLSPTTAGYLPYRELNSGNISLCAALITRVTDNSTPGAPTEHTVVVSYRLREDGTPDHGIWCADKFVDGGSLSLTEKAQRIDAALLLVPTSKQKKVRKSLESMYGKHPESGACSFWKTFRRDKKLCSHTKAVLAYLQLAQPGFLAQLEADYEDALAGGASATSDPSGLLTLEELAFDSPVLIEGDRGSGKTTEVRQFARANNYPYVEMGGHEGIEAAILLGYLVPYGNGQMVWKDGPLAEAFRKARTSKVVFLMDEILRVPARELSILLTALSPDEGMYHLRTGRVLSVEDGVATEEVLSCPTSNLFVVATTNVGSEYSVDEIDPAIAERFMPMRKDTELAQLTAILTAKAKSLKLSSAVCKATVDFFKKMTAGHQKGLVHRCPTTRTLTRAFDLSKGVDAGVKRALQSQALLWVARTADGRPVPEQVTTVNDLLTECFKSC